MEPFRGLHYPAIPLPLPPQYQPQGYDAARVFGRGFNQLPLGSQALLMKRQAPMQLHFTPGAYGGRAAEQSLSVNFPSASLNAPKINLLGPIGAGDIAAHEFAHEAGWQAFSDPSGYDKVNNRFQEYLEKNPGFAIAARRGHEGINPQSWTALSEYIASLLERQGQPTRVPAYTPEGRNDPVQKLLDVLLYRGTQ